MDEDLSDKTIAELVGDVDSATNRKSDSGDEPVTMAQRVAYAIREYYTSEKTQQDIADELGVARETVSRYVNTPPDDAVLQHMHKQQAKARMLAFEELERQLQIAGQKSRSAEKPTEVWTDDDGKMHVRDVENDEGEVVTKKPVPIDIAMGKDDESRYYARSEIRDILKMMIELTGAAEPREIDLDVTETSDDDIEELRDAISELKD